MTEEELYYTDQQKLICAQFGVSHTPSPFNKMIAVAMESFKQKVLPVHGLRHPVQNENVTNWYIWCGEYSEAEDFFKPIHVLHLVEIYPAALKFLGLAPGWRFLTDGSYEDVWFDKKLLEI